MSSDKFSRRRFVSESAGVAVAAWIATGLPGVREAVTYARRAAVTAEPPSFEFFNPEEAADIAAIAAQIWPADDTPGDSALEAGIPHFIDNLFAARGDGSFSDLNFVVYDGPIGADPI